MKFRKKPVVIDAVQFKFNDAAIAELETFCGETLGNIRKEHDASPAGLRSNSLLGKQVSNQYSGRRAGCAPNCLG